MWPERQPRDEARPHAYDLYDEGSQIGTLLWRARPRRAVGWYLTLSGAPAVRLFVDTAIDELARDERSTAHDWDLHAELAAILSSALALDAAGRVVHPERAQGTRRFRRGLAAGRYEIHVTDVETAILARITPELHLDSVSNVTILAGELMQGGLEVAIQRIGLVGGRIVAVFHSDELEDPD
jgi:hypothetical protein